MNKIPVGRSIAHAYGFLFGRILTVVCLSWVAAVFYAVLRFALFKLGPIPHPIVDHWQPALLHLGGLLGSLLLFSAIAIPLTRAALGHRQEWRLAHFVIGGSEIRLFLAVLRVYVIVIALIALCVAAAIGAGMGVDAILAQWPAAAASGLPIAFIAHAAVVALAVLVTIYVSFRLSFLLYPVAAAEPHASLRRVWSLAGGNVLRIFVVILAAVVPVYVLAVGAEYALMGPALVEACRALFTSAKPDIAPLVSLFVSHAGAISVGAGALLVVLVALGSGASAAAYLALTGSGREDIAAEEVDIAVEAVPAADAHQELQAQAEPADPSLEVGAEPESEPEPQDYAHEAHGDDAQVHADHSAAPEHAVAEHLELDRPLQYAPEEQPASVDVGEDPLHAYAAESGEGLAEAQVEGADAGQGEVLTEAAATADEAAPEELPPHQPAEAPPQTYAELREVLDQGEPERTPEHT